jgi:general secretion pathway protein J
LFIGSKLSVTFVRTALGPNARLGLDVVRVGETTDQGELVTVRSRTSFQPLPPGSSLSEQIHFSDHVVLLRSPFRLSFAYAGQDMIWRNSWRDADQLPSAIKLTVRDAASERILSVSTVVPVHVQLSADCIQPQTGCGSKPDEAQDASKTGKGGASTESEGTL